MPKRSACSTASSACSIPSLCRPACAYASPRVEAHQGRWTSIAYVRQTIIVRSSTEIADAGSPRLRCVTNSRAYQHNGERVTCRIDLTHENATVVECIFE